MSLFLVHGGLWENMNAQRFWHTPGVTQGLTAAGRDWTAPDRLPRPMSWRDDVDHLSAHVPTGRLTILGASNGCTPAIELALRFTHRLDALLLAWPATQGDPHVDAQYSRGMRDQGAETSTIEQLLTGQTLRGITHRRIRALPEIPVALIPAPPGSPTHQRHTVDALADLLDHAEILPTFPETPRPEFAAARQDFLATITGWLTTAVPATKGQPT